MNPNKPFFPVTEDLGTDYQGISTRDYIAIEAMKSVIEARFLPNVEPHRDFVARIAYEFADALIAESNK